MNHLLSKVLDQVNNNSKPHNDRKVLLNFLFLWNHPAVGPNVIVELLALGICGLNGCVVMCQ